jgi:hypothetical protein
VSTLQHFPGTPPGCYQWSAPSGTSGLKSSILDSPDGMAGTSGAWPEILGLQAPVAVIAFADYTWDKSGPHFANSTLCAVDICLKQFEVSVVDNVANTKLVVTVFGTKQIQKITFPDRENPSTVQCWQPNDRPTRWYTAFDSKRDRGAGTSVHDPISNGYCGCSGYTNPPNAPMEIAKDFTATPTQA